MLEDNSLVLESAPEPALESGPKAASILVRNSTFYLAADAVVKLLSFVFNVYIVRQLGDERFGLYSAVLAYVGIFSIIGDLGMTQYAAREIARGRRKADDMFWDLVIIRMALAIAATIFIVASAAFVAGYQANMVWGMFLACIGFFFHAFFGPIRIILTGRERIDYVSVLTIVIQLFFIGVGTWVLLGGYSFHGLIVASYVGVPVATIIGAVYIRRLKLATLKVHITPENWVSLLKYSLPFAVITFTIVAAKDLDTVLLSLWRSPEEVGWYRAAYNLIYKLLFIKGALLSTLTPQMSRYYGLSRNRVAKAFNSSFKILWAFSFPIAVGTTLLARPLTVWLYTDEFAQSAIVLAILIWALPLLNLSSLCGSITTATDKEKKAARAYTLAALLNLVINFVAIPIWGYLGAAVATVVTEAAALLLFYAILHREFPLTDLTNTLLKPAVAGLVMAAVILVLQSWHLFIVISIGAAVYALALFALKPLNRAELEVIQGLWLSLRRRIRWGVS
jgi:O-antigen/teichoic acid export membrane protein